MKDEPARIALNALYRELTETQQANVVDTVMRDVRKHEKTGPDSADEEEAVRILRGW